MFLIINHFSKYPSQDSSVGSASAWYQWGPRFKYRDFITCKCYMCMTEIQTIEGGQKEVHIRRANIQSKINLLSNWHCQFDGRHLINQGKYLGQFSSCEWFLGAKKVEKHCPIILFFTHSYQVFSDHENSKNSLTCKR